MRFTNTEIVDVTLSLDISSAYTSGDVLADTQEVTNALRANVGRGLLQSLVVNDKDDQGVAFDLVLLKSNVALGTENSPPSITDANADNILGVVSVAAGDYIDLGGCRVATVRNIGLALEVSTTSLYIAAITRGTPTHTASGLALKLGIVRD